MKVAGVGHESAAVEMKNNLLDLVLQVLLRSRLINGVLIAEAAVTEDGGATGILLLLEASHFLRIECNFLVIQHANLDRVPLIVAAGVAEEI